MKKYEVPVMKLHKLKTSSIVLASREVKPVVRDDSGASTQDYEDAGFKAGDYFN